MSNRVMWILILSWFVLAIIAFYLYFFKYNRVNIEITSNLPNYEVELFSTDIKTTFNKSCEKEKCVFEDFSPFNYKVKVTKKWYRDFYSNLNIRDNWNTKVSVVLEKDIYLWELEKKDITYWEKYIINDSKEDKIKELRERKLIKKTIILDNLWKFVFKESAEKIEIVLNWEKSLWLFEPWEIETLNIRSVYYTDSFVFINVWEKKYLYNLVSKNFYDIGLFIKINYIKAWENNLNFRFVTDKGTFIFNTTTLELKYFPLFKDYEIVWNKYIWIIYKDEEEKFQNYWIDNTWENYIVELWIEEPILDILLKQNINISKILKKEKDEWKDRIFIFRNDEEFYELMNY